MSNEQPRPLDDAELDALLARAAEATRAEYTRTDAEQAAGLAEIFASSEPDNRHNDHIPGRSRDDGSCASGDGTNIAQGAITDLTAGTAPRAVDRDPLVANAEDLALWAELNAATGRAVPADRLLPPSVEAALAELSGQIERRLDGLVQAAATADQDPPPSLVDRLIASTGTYVDLLTTLRDHTIDHEGAVAAVVRIGEHLLVVVQQQSVLLADAGGGVLEAPEEEAMIVAVCQHTIAQLDWLFRRELDLSPVGGR